MRRQPRAHPTASTTSVSALFTPVGPARDNAVVALRQVIAALAEDDTTLSAAILDRVQPDSPDDTTATVSACIGVALGLLDDWLSGRHQHAPAGLVDQTRLPVGHWLGERAATDILVLARKAERSAACIP